MKYKLGISTCPNDTFMFHAILERAIDMEGMQLEIELLDVQELNQRLDSGTLELSKASCYAAARILDRYEICPAGAALGFGVGPLLLARSDAPPLDANARVLCPGALTTAGLLFRHLYPAATRIENVVFSEIMPALENGSADYGVVIHEGRFTYAQQGLTLISDLGQLWESEFQVPLPLGCIVASRELPIEVRERFARLVKRSILYAHEHRSETLYTMQRYAQELSEPVIWAHVDLYVNEWSLDLGDDGRRALDVFMALAQGDRYPVQA